MTQSLTDSTPRYFTVFHTHDGVHWIRKIMKHDFTVRPAESRKEFHHIFIGTKCRRKRRLKGSIRAHKLRNGCPAS